MAELTDGTAELRVLVTTALGALPLENAIVSVSTVQMCIRDRDLPCRILS